MEGPDPQDVALAAAKGLLDASELTASLIEEIVQATAVMFPEGENDIAGDAAYGCALDIRKRHEETVRDLRTIVGAMHEYGSDS
jgi:hypothetical protein